jgi:ASPIC and UnbV
LGNVDADVAIEIRWPSGIVQTLKHVRVDRQVQVDEPGS